MPLYNLKSLEPNVYAIAKFDEDFNVLAVYELTPKGTGFECNCPASQRTVKLKPCKHQKMLPMMLGAVNTDRFYDPATRRWCEPLRQTEHSGPVVELSVDDLMEPPSPTVEQRPRDDKLALSVSTPESDAAEEARVAGSPTAVAATELLPGEDPQTPMRVFKELGNGPRPAATMGFRRRI